MLVVDLQWIEQPEPWGDVLAVHSFREEQVNIQLAELLAKRGLDANAETIIGRKLPDVLISLDGVKLVIEGRFTKNTAQLLQDARARIEDGVADLSMALVYTSDLKTAESQDELRRGLEKASFDGTVFYVAKDGIAEQSIVAGSIDDLVRTINLVFGLRIRNDIVRHQVESLSASLDRVVTSAMSENLFFRGEAVKKRLRQALGLD